MSIRTWLKARAHTPPLTPTPAPTHASGRETAAEYPIDRDKLKENIQTVGADERLGLTWRTDFAEYLIAGGPISDLRVLYGSAWLQGFATAGAFRDDSDPADSDDSEDMARVPPGSAWERGYG